LVFGDRFAKRTSTGESGSEVRADFRNIWIVCKNLPVISNGLIEIAGTLCGHSGLEQLLRRGLRDE
jgi:hypothetical protein